MRDDITEREFNEMYTAIRERLARMDKKRDDLIKAELARSTQFSPSEPIN